MVNFLDLYDVYDRHGHIDVDRNVQVVLFVKTERGYFLVVVVLGGEENLYKTLPYFFKKNIV